MIKAHFLPEVDDKGNPLKIKCVGELGMCGAGAASANAVYDVCGVRIHEHPLTVNKVIAGLEKQPAQSCGLPREWSPMELRNGLNYLTAIRC